jgi:hypothetical protein
MVTFTSKFSALVGFAFLACVAAAPLEAKSATAVTLPLIKHVYTSAQASSKRSSIADRRDNVPLTNLVAIYTVPVTIGSQTFNLFVDTASSVIWAGVSPFPARLRTKVLESLIYSRRRLDPLHTLVDPPQ